MKPFDAVRWICLLTLLPSVGCAMLSLRGGKETAEQLEKLGEEEGTPLISRYAHPYGMDWVKVESVGLVTGLDGTGSDPVQSTQRATLLDEMNRRKVDKPNAVLASPTTSLVLVRGFLPPGVQKGDRFDVEVRTTSRSETTSLRGGRLLEADMTQLAVLGQQIREGHLWARAEGAVLVDPSADASGDALATRGRVLSGGVSLRTRDLGLIVGNNHVSVRMTQSIAKAVNERFQAYERGRQIGVAEAKNDEFIKLRVHPRYKDNVGRYVRVVRSIALQETATARIERAQLLSKQLLDPLTTSRAALRLEAIGGELAIAPLLKGLESKDLEVRFYSAEALAYLDQTAGVKALAEAARDEPALRVHALAALSAMDDVNAYDSLRLLLSSKSAETRYGAFRALRAMNAGDPLIRGEELGGQFGFHVLDIEGPKMVHVTRSRRPEIVLFGAGQQFELPMVLDAGTEILINGMTHNEVVVTRITAGEAETKRRVVSADVEEVIRAIVELGGVYPDVVQALQQAKNSGALPSRFRVDAIPRAGREMEADEELAQAASDGSAGEGSDMTELDDTTAPGSYRVATPVPDLFSNQR
ncbi:flagellar basal body P-ring protein FlgI [Botrimarina hoheduenensis]|uniref:Flagellar basal body P-ring protein n=1 Tax=Botrimarina hoheduenensis TaxID=2528000 RepID=A0A5C5WDM9_9BACT|nr:flagellar basal body P-ring protein FlgI [Botrimarina hoheduenensis]TWT48607.1 flagellar basal body P-ring protein [Botrimarina hoheduenensis]